MQRTDVATRPEGAPATTSDAAAGGNRPTTHPTTHPTADPTTGEPTTAFPTTAFPTTGEPTTAVPTTRALTGAREHRPLIGPAAADPDTAMSEGDPPQRRRARRDGGAR